MAKTLHYYDHKSFLLQRYGHPVYRVPLDLGLGCPHREAHTSSSGGCIFCDEEGSRAGFLGEQTDLVEQVRRGTEFLKNYETPPGLIAYFQAFTSTNAPAEQLRKLFAKALNAASFEAVNVSTRPDCLSDETLDFFTELREEYDVWVELGVQSSNEETLARINRGHGFEASADAIKRLHTKGIPVATHVIIGLPGETSTDWLQTAKDLTSLPVSGVKIHNLHVLRGTHLETLWRQGEIRTMDEYEYAEHLMDFLRWIPAVWPVMRLLSDTHADKIRAPKWGMTKTEFLDHIEKQMIARGVRQGDLYDNQADTPATPQSEPKDASDLAPLQKSARNLADALIQVITPGSNAAPSKSPIRVLDLGFGADFAVPALMEGKVKGDLFSQQRLEIDCVPLIDKDLRQPCPTDTWQRWHKELLRDKLCEDEGTRVRLLIDPTDIEELTSSYDAILLEPRYPERYMSVFTVGYLSLLHRLINEDGLLLSSLTTNRLRARLLQAGFRIGTANSTLLRRGGTLAAKDADLIPQSVSSRDIEVIRNQHGVTVSI